MPHASGDELPGLVLDLSRLLPGPLCGRMLAAMGYRVLRLLPPGGDWLDRIAPDAAAWLRSGVECETVDLKSPGGRERLRGLVAQASVLLENHLPGRMEAWEVGPEALRQINAELVYVRLAGSRDPGARALPGHDLTYLASAGLLPRLESAARQLPLADLCGAFWAALAAERGLRRGGGFYEVYLEEAAWPAAWPPIPGLDGSRCNYAVYPARSGRVALAALEPHLWTRVCAAAGHPEWEPHAHAPARAGEAVYDAICGWLRTRPADEWDAWAVAERLPLRAVKEHSPEPAAPWIVR